MDTKSSNLEQGYQASLQDLEKGFQQQAPASPLAPPKPVSPPTMKDRAETVAQQLERGPETLPGLARLAGLPGVAKWLPGDYALQQQMALPGKAALGPLKPVSQAIGKVLNPSTLLGRAATQGALGTVEGGLEKKGPVRAGIQGAVQAASSIGSDALSTAGRYLYSAAPKHLFEQKSGRQLANWLRQNIPAWSEIRGPRALYQMAKEGEQPLKDAFATEFEAAKASLPPDATIEITRDAARKAGLKGEVAPIAPSGRGFEGPEMVKVPAREAAEATLGLKKKDPGARGEIIDALGEQAPSGWIPEARRAYQLGKGWQQFAGNLFKSGEKYDAYEAQKLLRGQAGQALEKRGMDAPRDIIRGPLTTGPLKRYQPSPWATRIAGLGLLGGGVGTGHPELGGLGALAGAGLEMAPRMSFYSGVPKTGPGATTEQARRILLQSILQQAQNSGPQGLPPSR